MSKIFKELQRRNVIKAAITYIVISWTLLQVAALVFPIFKVSESILRFLLIGLIIGFPFWLVFAYLFEWTPTGLKKTDHIDPEPAVQKKVSRRLNRIIISFLSLAVVLLITDRFVDFRTSSDSKVENTIAVLPFENQTGDPDLEYLADGMSQEICDRLASMKGLETIARRACLQYKNNDKTPVEIAKELKVKYLVEGNIRKSGNEIRFNSQLIDGSTGVQMASFPYAGKIEMGEILNKMDEAALQIARKLHLNLNPQEIEAVKKRYTENSQAYGTFLKGWNLYESIHSDVMPSVEKLEGAMEYFEKAIEQDSAFALAFAGISMVEAYLALMEVPAEYDRKERCLDLAKKALDLDSNLPEGHMAMGELAYINRRMKEAINHYDKSLSLKPENPVAWCHLASACRRNDIFNRGENAAKTAIELQPTYILAHDELGLNAWGQKKYPEAIKAFEYTAQLKPSWPYPYRQIGRIYFETQDYKNALEAFQKFEQLESSPGALVFTAFAYAGTGETELALSTLEKALEAGYEQNNFVESSLHFEIIENDERFKDIIAFYRNQIK